MLKKNLQLILNIVRNALNFKILDRAVAEVTKVKGCLSFLRKKNFRQERVRRKNSILILTLRIALSFFIHLRLDIDPYNNKMTKDV